MTDTPPPTPLLPLTRGSHCGSRTRRARTTPSSSTPWAHGRVPGAPPVEVTFADIDITNGMAERGEFDVLKVSYAVLPWVLDEYALLPCGGALGRGCGPLVLTREPGVDLTGRTVAVPSERSTAYLLFRLWAAGHVPGGVGEIVVLPFHEIMPAVRDGKVDAGLVIHEARFTYQDYGLHTLADMGEHWEATTGLPIPLGAIIARSGRWATADAAGGRRPRLRRQAWDDPGLRPYVLEHAQEMDPAVADQHIGLYVNEFTADLGEDGYAAVRGLAHTCRGRGAGAGGRGGCADVPLRVSVRPLEGLCPPPPFPGKPRDQPRAAWSRRPPQLANGTCGACASGPNGCRHSPGPPAAAARPRRTSRPPRGAGSRRG